MKIKNPDRIVPVHLRGTGMVPIWLEEYRDKLVEWFISNEVKYWILDPTAKAWEGLLETEADNIAAGQFVNAIDEVKNRAGIEETLLTHHTGRFEVVEGQERGRGPTRLEDWMDAGWYLTGQKDDLALRADGRDVNQEAIAIHYDQEAKRTFTATGLTRSEAREQAGAESVVDAVKKLNEEGENEPEHEHGKG